VDEASPDAPEPEGSDHATRAGAGRQAATPRARRSGITQFARECYAELQRVQWPGREQLWQSTAVVLVVCIIIATYLFLLDNYVFTQAAKWLIDKQNSK
jgi:preprotein translocase subunit SecE